MGIREGGEESMKLNLGFMATACTKAIRRFPATIGPQRRSLGRRPLIPADPPEVITATATVLPMTAYDLQYYEAAPTPRRTCDRPVMCSYLCRPGLNTTAQCLKSGRPGTTRSCRPAPL